MYKDVVSIKQEVLQNLTNKWSTPSHFIGFSDDKYYLPSYKDFRDYVYYNKILISPNNPVNQTEGFDCDDYSFILKGHVSIFNRDVAMKNHSWAVGIIWGEFSWIKGNHATNWVITRDKGIFLFEPQFNVEGFFPFSNCLGNVQLILI